MEGSREPTKVDEGGRVVNIDTPNFALGGVRAPIVGRDLVRVGAESHCCAVHARAEGVVGREVLMLSERIAKAEEDVAHDRNVWRERETIVLKMLHDREFAVKQAEARACALLQEAQLQYASTSTSQRRRA